MRCGADTGGTFTDIVADDGRVLKVLSSPDDPSRAVAGGLGQWLAGGRPDLLAHGTTVATNALLERRGGRVALLTTSGFADVIEIARQDRPSLYDINVDRPVPLVPRELRLEVGGRLDATGSEIEALDPAAVPDLPTGVDSVAVCLLHADLYGGHERAVAAVLAARGFDDVSCSSDVAPEFREYERTVTTAVNAYLRPRCRRYLRSLAGFAERVLVMTSAGGLLGAEEAGELPVALLLSGPAGGVRAGAVAAAAAGFADAVTFDMGGTSTDVCLVRGGSPEPSPERVAAGLPIRLPALDILTIGAGGGSLAGLDPGGALKVGPASAGADPGPACYGRGGTRPTVTDADLVLGRIPSGAAFGGLALDVGAASRALTRAGVSAEGVVAVVDAAMERAVRAVSVERGVDPGGLALVAFGGAGPLHACAVAEGTGIGAVVIPPRAGVLSAVGLLCSPRQRDLVRSWPTPADHAGIPTALARLGSQAREAVAATEDSAAGVGAVEVTTTLDCRYVGQSHELTVGGVDAFDDEHRRRNGYSSPGAAIEVVALRARARVAAAVDVADLGPPTTPRRPIQGPAVVAEADCTVWVPAGWSGRVAGDGSWVLTPTADPR